MDLKDIQVYALPADCVVIGCKKCGTRLDKNIFWETLQEAINIAEEHKCDR